ncbi:hypothetical protein OP862_04585 [Yersinia massiliensis]|uniref:Uncharacterized protein n=1 Tax=Yersinia massiliensis TaxID=419257 RepID=A0AA90XWC6_9GAMM|nr:hypothetical protein [Yersinia massiliensis]MDA5549912.1 hypothetical protein [Yersinia massiliensis]NIL28183.1 hypothetical protein [Yersinia massiliensis]UZM79962.1 hypothetical protein OP862_04585 [Yersinia massiliensis]
MPKIKNTPAKGHYERRANLIDCCVDTCNINAVCMDKPMPKKHYARLYMLRSGSRGFTKNEILCYCHLSYGRNYATDVEWLLGIQLEKINEINNGGIGNHYRYRISSRRDVIQIIELVNRNATIKGHQQLTQHEIKNILYLYPEEPAIT